MTPAEIRALADAAEAETAANEQVAVVLGWEPTNTYQGFIWTRGYEWSEWPPMVTSLDALAAECARRGLGFSVVGERGVGSAMLWWEAWRELEIGRRFPYQIMTEAQTPAAALCAALLLAMATEKEATPATHPPAPGA